jgi:predicted GNAT family acetyltransferase
MTGNIQHEDPDHRGAFFIARDGKRVAWMSYSRPDAGLAIIDHTEGAAELGGQGVGRRLLDAAVTWARATDTKVRSTCPFVSAQCATDESLRDVQA